MRYLPALETRGAYHYAKLTGQRSMGIPEENGTGRYKSWTGSTRTASPGRINSDHLRLWKKNIKLNEIETFTHLKVKIPVKNGPNEETLATFLHIALCCQM